MNYSEIIAASEYLGGIREEFDISSLDIHELNVEHIADLLNKIKEEVDNIFWATKDPLKGCDEEWRAVCDSHENIQRCVGIIGAIMVIEKK